MKKILIYLFLSELTLNLYAQQSNRNEIVAIATTTMRSLGKNVYPTDVDSIYRIQNNSNTLLQEVVFSSGESVLLTGHKSCMPVIGYTLPEAGGHSSPILKDYDDLPGGIKDIVGYYSIQVENCFNSDDVLPLNTEWISLQSFEQTRNSNIIIVDPLLTSKWGQDTSNCGGDPQAYNYYVTESSGYCTHCFAGCGPVAMAQIMYYWKYPVLSHVFEDSFDWCNMPNFLSTLSDNYEKERNAVAKLIRHCGLAANAHYCSNDCETGSYPYELASALQDLGYESEFKERHDYLTSDWIAMIKLELDNSRPILYSGYHELKGHTFVCDGYSSYNYFHFNWGWNGRHNDLWLTLDDICPGGYNFTGNQNAVFKIEPLNNQNYCDFSLPLDYYYSLITSIFGDTILLYSVTPRMMTVLTSAPSTSPTSYRTIPSGATAEYVAHKTIILQPGFKAEYGSNFTARIEPCESCEERMVQMEMLTSEESENITDSSDCEMRMFKVGDTVIVMQTSNLQLYPNPTDNTVTVKSPDKIENIRILDNLGRPVSQWFLESNEEGLLTLNVRNIPKGIYILQLTTSDKKTHFGRFIKN